jgi:acetolactate synthase-1/2/3 large subunit
MEYHRKRRDDMKITGAEAIIKALELEGTDTIFGYPGAAISPFYDALLNSRIRHILTRHEQGAAHAANGYARVTGKPGVCVSTSGPGATNLITGIANAYMDSIPIIAITGQVRSDMIGTDAFQEADITGSAAPFTKHSYLVKAAGELPRIIKEAFHIAATGRPGPVVIDIPIDVQNSVFEFQSPKAVEIKGYKPTVKGHPMQIKKAAAALEEAKKPVICAGGGVIAANAAGEMLKKETYRLSRR